MSPTSCQTAPPGLVLPGVVLIPTIVFKAAGVSDAVTVGGVRLHRDVRRDHDAARTPDWPLRRGLHHCAGTSGPAIAVSIAALAAGGPALLATLILALALFQFAFSARLHLFRRILNPTVTGTIITDAEVMPFIFAQLKNVHRLRAHDPPAEGDAPAGASPPASPRGSPGAAWPGLDLAGDCALVCRSPSA